MLRLRQTHVTAREVLAEVQHDADGDTVVLPAAEARAADLFPQVSAPSNDSHPESSSAEDARASAEGDDSPQLSEANEDDNNSHVKPSPLGEATTAADHITFAQPPEASSNHQAEASPTAEADGAHLPQLSDANNASLIEADEVVSSPASSGEPPDMLAQLRAEVLHKYHQDVDFASAGWRVVAEMRSPGLRHAPDKVWIRVCCWYSC